jgi:hypothetical protein
MKTIEMQHDRHAALFACLCDKSTHYRQSVFLPNMAQILGLRDQTTVLESIRNDETALLRALLGYYAFARAGGERAHYADIAVQALTGSLESAAGYAQAMKNPRFGDAVWAEFVKRCAARQVGTNEKLNRGSILGCIALAQMADDRFASWIRRKLEIDVEMLFIDLTAYKGLGPKIACFILRDLAWIFDIEGRVPPEKKLFLQPVDTWVLLSAHLPLNIPQFPAPHV